MVTVLANGFIEIPSCNSLIRRMFLPRLLNGSVYFAVKGFLRGGTMLFRRTIAGVCHQLHPFHLNSDIVIMPSIICSISMSRSQWLLLHVLCSCHCIQHANCSAQGHRNISRALIRVSCMHIISCSKFLNCVTQSANLLSHLHVRTLIVSNRNK